MVAKFCQIWSHCTRPKRWHILIQNLFGEDLALNNPGLSHGMHRHALAHELEGRLFAVDHGVN